MLSIIVAKAKNNIIGKDNGMLWKIPDDLKRFKEKTSGHTIIMGRKTFESLGGILPERMHIILSRNPDFNIDSNCVKVVHSLLELQPYMEDEEEHFVIGGAIVYNLLMPYANKMYITQIDKDFEGDSLFPKINEEDWKEVSREEGQQDGINDFKYEYITYVRKKEQKGHY
ncbi:MAG: dihydrofolate reductase [Clostridia bacterium]|nr:dihydrofolate reductase [Clostridia bacterium]